MRILLSIFLLFALKASLSQTISSENIVNSKKIDKEIDISLKKQDTLEIRIDTLNNNSHLKIIKKVIVLNNK